MLHAGGSARADETVAAIIAAGGRAIAVGGDVADEHDMAGVFDRVEQEWGRIDVVVNTAGICSSARSRHSTSPIWTACTA